MNTSSNATTRACTTLFGATTTAYPSSLTAGAASCPVSVNRTLYVIVAATSVPTLLLTGWLLRRAKRAKSDLRSSTGHSDLRSTRDAVRHVRTCWLCHTLLESVAQLTLFTLLASGVRIPVECPGCVILPCVVGFGVMAGTLYIIAIWLYMLPRPLLQQRPHLLVFMDVFLANLSYMDAGYFMIFIIASSILSFLPLLNTVEIVAKVFMIEVAMAVLPPLSVIPYFSVLIFDMTDGEYQQELRGQSESVRRERSFCRGAMALLCVCKNTQHSAVVPQGLPSTKSGKKYATATRTTSKSSSLRVDERRILRASVLRLKLRFSFLIVVVCAVSAGGLMLAMAIVPFLFDNAHIFYSLSVFLAQIWQLAILGLFFLRMPRIACARHEEGHGDRVEVETDEEGKIKTMSNENENTVSYTTPNTTTTTT